MFEILFDDEGMKEDTKKDKEEREEEQEEEEDDKRQKEEEVGDNSLSLFLFPFLSFILSLLPEQEVDPLNQTLSFQEGEELKLKDWSELRRGWSQRTPQTLLDALANMEVNSVYNTAVEAEQGEHGAGEQFILQQQPEFDKFKDHLFILQFIYS